MVVGQQRSGASCRLQRLRVWRAAWDRRQLQRPGGAFGVLRLLSRLRLWVWWPHRMRQLNAHLSTHTTTNLQRQQQVRRFFYDSILQKEYGDKLSVNL
jgi:hypothetical protein